MPNQDYALKTVRASAIPTASYVAGTVLEETHLLNQLILLISYTKGAETSLQVKVEFSPDNSTYYQETFSAISGGTDTDTLGVHQFTATGNYRLSIPIKDRYIKVSTKGTTGSDFVGSLVAINAIVGIA
jgi:hypothetical protein